MNTKISADKVLSSGYITLSSKNYKSVMDIGNVKVYTEKQFNWLNKIMFKIFFGIKIEDYKEK